ncbi:hypothetical protein [Streptococcus infantis]|uniref:hypothetical protein n=1 Tax=Streptococcus infantis TaxID=68892 RepID=UPI0039C0457E
MKKINFKVDNPYENIDRIRKIISNIVQVAPDSYIYFGNIVSYSKYDGDDSESIKKRQELIDYNADVNFYHFKMIEVNAFYEYLYHCKYIEDGQIIVTNKEYDVEDIYRLLATPGEFVLDLEVLEGELFYIRYDDMLIDELIFKK